MQEAFITAAVKRVAVEEGFHEQAVAVSTRNGSGGIPAAKATLERFLRDLRDGAEDRPDILVICLDGDCEGPDSRREEILQMVGDDLPTPPCVVVGTPDPYIERWYLLDSGGIKKALGRGPKAHELPPRCSHDVFKDLLAETIESTGAVATLGGYEYADLIVGDMDLYQAGHSDASFDRFLSDLRSCLKLLLN